MAEKIGMGAVGAVYKGISDTGEIVAIKQISLHNISNEKLQSIETEIGLLKKLNHENIVKYKGHLFFNLEYIKQKN